MADLLSRRRARNARPREAGDGGMPPFEGESTPDHPLVSLTKTPATPSVEGESTPGIPLPRGSRPPATPDVPSASPSVPPEHGGEGETTGGQRGRRGRSAADRPGVHPARSSRPVWVRGGGEYRLLSQPAPPALDVLLASSPVTAVGRVLAAVAAGLGLWQLCLLLSPGVHPLAAVISPAAILIGGALGGRLMPRRRLVQTPDGDVFTESRKALLGIALGVFLGLGIVAFSWGHDLAGTWLIGISWLAYCSHIVWRTSIARQWVKVREHAAVVKYVKTPEEEVTDVWYSRVAPKVWTAKDKKAAANKKLPTTGLSGAKLSSVTMREDGGWTGVVRLPDGDSTWGTVQEKAPLIAKAYRTHAEHIVASPHRAGGDAFVELVVGRTDPLAATYAWRGPSLRRGLIEIAHRVNATRGHLPLWVPGQGAQHGLIAGATGSGKSCYGVPLVEAVLSGVAYTVLMDPKGGSSHKLLVESGLVQHVAVDDEAIMATLRGLDAIINARMAAGQVVDNPTRKVPLILAVLDEAVDMFTHPVYGKEARYLAGRIARRGRAAMVALYCCVQQAVKTQFGNDDSIRSQLMGMNLLCFYTADSGGAQVFAGTVLKGVHLPSIGRGRPGVGYVPGAENSPALSRVLYLDRKSITVAKGLNTDPVTDVGPAATAAWTRAIETPGDTP